MEEHERRVELHELSLVIGGLQNAVRELQRVQEQTSGEVRGDIQRVHEKLDNMYQNGCAKAAQHGDTETRLRVVETWKIGHDAETKAIATQAGGEAGSTSGRWVAAIISIIVGVITYFSSKGSGQ